MVLDPRDALLPCNRRSSSADDGLVEGAVDVDAPYTGGRVLAADAERCCSCVADDDRAVFVALDPPSYGCCCCCLLRINANFALSPPESGMWWETGAVPGRTDPYSWSRNASVSADSAAAFTSGRNMRFSFSFLSFPCYSCIRFRPKQDRAFWHCRITQRHCSCANCY